MKLPLALRKQILEFGCSYPNEEVCGYVGVNQTVVMLPNLAEDKTASFIMDLPDGEALAIWHTHTDESATLSFMDVEQARINQLPYICCDPVNDDWDFYDPNFTHPYPLNCNLEPNVLPFYLDRPFAWGRSDCYEIARDYYRGMLGIEIGTVERKSTEEKEWYTGWDRYNQELPGKGFQKLDVSEPFQLHDLLLLYGLHYDAAHHVMICVSLEPLQFLHLEKPGAVSEITSLAPYEKNLHGGSIWRHQNVAKSKN